MKDNTVASTNASTGTETPTGTDTVEMIQGWVVATVLEKEKLVRQKHLARSGQHHAYTLPSSDEREVVIKNIKEKAWIPSEAKGRAFVGCIETDSLGGLLVFVATKTDMVSEKAMLALHNRLRDIPSAPGYSDVPRGNSVIDKYRKGMPVAERYMALPDGSIETSRGARAHQSEMMMDLLRITDAA